jgi:hypothetical protein
MSEIKVDTLTGKTSAGDIDVTSEGGAATMQLQQGLAKAWATVNGSSGTPSLTVSLNGSSVTDLGTGSYATNLTNAMSDANYPITGSDNERGCGESNNNTTSRVDRIIRNPTNLTAVDATLFFAVHGDLA